MRKLILVSCIYPLLFGCVTPRREYRSIESFEPEAVRRVNLINILADDNQYLTEQVKPCNLKNARKRADCLDHALDKIMAEIRLHYPLAARNVYDDWYLTHVDEFVAKRMKNFQGSSIDRDLNSMLSKVYFYEDMVRRSQIRQLTLHLYNEDNNSVSAYNQAAAEKDAADERALSSLSQTLNSTNQQMQLDRIEERQKHLEWQHRNDEYKRNGGIIPTH